MFFTLFLFSQALSSNLGEVWDELNNAFDPNTSPGEKLTLELDAFEHVDLDHDGILSTEEWTHFMESAVERIFGDLTPEDIRGFKDNLVYPVFEVTDDMSEGHVRSLCALAQDLEELDLAEEFENLAENPSLLLSTALEIVRMAPSPVTNVWDFGSFMEEANHLTFSEELVIPEECKTLAVQTPRRRAFGGAIVAGMAALGSGVGAALQKCAEGNCDQANKAFVKESEKTWNWSVNAFVAPFKYIHEVDGTYDPSESWSDKWARHRDDANARKNRAKWEAANEAERREKEAEAVRAMERAARELVRQVEQMLASQGTSTMVRGDDRMGRRV